MGVQRASFGERSGTEMGEHGLFIGIIEAIA